MEQRVYFDNKGKLQITTDNGQIMDNGATTQTKIEGTFTIEAKDVARLITHFSGKVTCTRRTMYWGAQEAYYIATDKEFTESVEYQKNLEEKLMAANKEWGKMSLLHEKLLRKIKEHNDNCGFFGRKIKIEDNND